MLTKNHLIAHEKAWEVGVLHRDVSEHNILITHARRRGETSYASLIDWDLSYWQGSKGAENYEVPDGNRSVGPFKLSVRRCRLSYVGNLGIRVCAASKVPKETLRCLG